MSWTEERVSVLRQLWEEGKSASEIAVALGEGVTRNAVIGKAHRLRLANRAPCANPRDETAPAPVRERKKPDSASAPKRRVLRKGYHLADIKERMCRWPHGDPREPDFHFCGAPTIAGLPYCAEHARMAYQTLSRARHLDPDDFEDKMDIEDIVPKKKGQAA